MNMTHDARFLHSFPFKLGGSAFVILRLFGGICLMNKGPLVRLWDRQVRSVRPLGHHDAHNFVKK